MGWSIEEDDFCFMFGHSIKGKGMLGNASWLGVSRKRTYIYGGGGDWIKILLHSF